MDNSTKVVPISYRTLRSGVVESPGLFREHVKVPESSDQTVCLVLEIENHQDFARVELEHEENGGPAPTDDTGLHRLMLNLPDARKLCHNLITRLAGLNDPVAKPLRVAMLEIMVNEQKKRQTNSPCDCGGFIETTGAYVHTERCEKG